MDHLYWKQYFWICVRYFELEMPGYYVSTRRQGATRTMEFRFRGIEGQAEVLFHSIMEDLQLQNEVRAKYGPTLAIQLHGLLELALKIWSWRTRTQG
jgi:hypothetical protein